MARAISSFMFRKLSTSSSSCHTRIQSLRSSKLIINAQYSSDVRKEHVVIVGGGIGGLATALSLHRLGVQSLVLEQSELLRTGGTSLTLSKNAWSVLDSIGVANYLRPRYLEIQGIDMKSEDGRKLGAINFKEADESQEVRAVERRVLLETLAGQLPPDTIQYSSRLVKIEPSPNGDTLLEFLDGSKLVAKIVIGCDGVGSPIAKWMGFSEPKYVGYCAFRGLASYSDGQPFEPRVNYIYGKGLRAGYVPVSPTKVYWFICFNSSSSGSTTNEPSVLKKQAKDLVENFPPELLNIIDSTPDDTLVRNPLVDRWLWPLISPPVSAGKVVLVGDAWHPMTPNLGQGACCALEDAAVLAKKLAGAINSDNSSVEEAFRSYGNERWRRIFPITILSNLVGSVFHWDNSLFCSVRNNILIPKLARHKDKNQS